MLIEVDGLGSDNAFVGLKKTEGQWIELGVGYRESAQRALVVRIDPKQAKDIARALCTIAASAECSPAPASPVIA
jgi:hypothetical protein